MPAAAVLLLAYAPASAQEREPIDVSALGPQVGEKIPDLICREKRRLGHAGPRWRGVTPSR